jgi:uncharacterized membrane protein (UPF0127 family)
MADAGTAETPPDAGPPTRLVNRTTGRVLAARVRRSETLWALFVGGMGRAMPLYTALGLTPCNWVHTFFVPAPLDVVYCDRAGLVLLVVPGLRPGRFGPRVPGARTVWEAAAGLFAGRVYTGDLLEAETVSEESGETETKEEDGA